MRVQRADEVVARRESSVPTPRDEAARAEVLRPVALGRERDAAPHDRERAEHERRAQGSSRKTSAIATAKSGAAPSATDVRDAPTSWIASVNRICEQPGREQAGEQERPGAMDVVRAGRAPRRRDRERDE